MKMKLLVVVALSSLVLICSGQVNQVQAGKTWCVASLTATDSELTDNINFVCPRLTSKNCDKLIGQGGICWEPNTLMNHASVVMNAYYAENGRNPWNCDFRGTGVVAVSDPSFGQCVYE